VVFLTKFDIAKHVLVPKHIKLSEKEKSAFMEKYGVSQKQLPKILKTDPAIQSLNVQEGDIIKIIRKSPTAGESVFYRGVTNG